MQNKISLCLLPILIVAILVPLNPVSVDAAAIHAFSDSGASSEAGLHPVSIVEADIYVNRFKTTVRLKCFAEDLELLQGVEALEDGFYDSDELREATDDHAKYLAKKIQLLDVDGAQYEATVTDITHIQFPEEGRIRQGNLMNFPIGFVLEISHEEPPEFITVNQQMVAEGALLPSELKVLIKQAGSDMSFPFKILKPDQAETYRFDWEGKPLSKEASEEEWASWFEEERKKNLGITSYSSVYSFIYITHNEVRHEVLIPLATLATMTEFERAETSYLTVEEQDAAKPILEAIFSEANPVVIDGIRVTPVFDRIDFYGLNLRDFAMHAERRKISMASGRVGLIMEYSTKGTPKNVDVTWDLFNSAIKSVDSIVIAFDEVSKTEFTKFLEDNTYTWSEPDREPLPPVTNVSSTIDFSNPPKAMVEVPKIELPLLSISLGLLACLILLGKWFLGLKWSMTFLLIIACGVGSLFTTSLMRKEVSNPTAEKMFVMPKEDADAIFKRLHKNMFRAFDYRQESDIYDALANSVDGDLLRSLYLDINESLKIKEQGGAVSQISEVRILEGGSPDEKKDPFFLSAPGFNYECKWNLEGTIEHWGHIHQRTNEYSAEFQVALVDDNWKITGMKMKGDPVPGVVKTTVRKFE